MKTLTILFVAAIMMGVGCSKSEDNENNPDKPDKPSPLPDLPDPNDVCSCMDDIIFMQYCYDNFDVNKDGKVSQIEAAAVSEIDLTDFEIKTLTGIGYFSNLEILNCKGCKNLISVDLSNNLKISRIGDSAFDGCNDLSEIIFNTNIVEIGESAFRNCSNLKRIDIPEKVTKLGIQVFERCDNLTSISIQGKVTEIGANAFSLCKSLENIDIPETVTEIGANAFWRCSNLKSIIIPRKVTEIGRSAFFGCSNLTSINIPKSVIEIGGGTFYNCSSLTNVTFEKESQLKSIISYGSDQVIFGNCPALTSIEIPASVETMEGPVFYNCSSLASVTFAKGSQLKFVMWREGAVFKECTALTDIEIPASVETMEGPVFQNCSSLTKVIFEEGSYLKSMVGEIYSNCPALISIEIPASIKKIANIVYNCNNLTHIYCHPIVPPEITDTYWGCENFVLYVPSQSLEAYKNSRWSNYYSSIRAIE